jgi:hypothetical protein
LLIVFRDASTVMNGIFLAGIGLAASFINVFWTWGYSRSAAKLLTTVRFTCLSIAHIGCVYMHIQLLESHIQYAKRTET